MDGGFFGNLFDMNHDGELDCAEKTMDFIAFNELMEGIEKEDLLDDEEG